MAVSKRLRFEILRRDNHACRYCGRTAPDVKLTVDHVIPETLGGSDDPTNLVTACADCNSGKSSVPADAPLVEDVAQDALRWARAIEQAAADLQANEEAYQRRLEPYLDVIRGSWYEDLPEDWESSVATFMRSGLPWPVMDDLVTVALNARTRNYWRYFCGCCWTRIRQIQERAAELVNAEEASRGE